MEDLVECRSDHDYAGRPVTLVWEGCRYQVAGLVQAWRTPEGKRFLVRTAGEELFDLVYDENGDAWQIQRVG